MIPGCFMAVKLLGSFLHAPLMRALAPELVEGLRTCVDDRRIVVQGTAGDTGRALPAAFRGLKRELAGASECVLQPSKCVALGSSTAHRQELGVRLKGGGGRSQRPLGIWDATPRKGTRGGQASCNKAGAGGQTEG